MGWKGELVWSLQEELLRVKANVFLLSLVTSRKAAAAVLGFVISTQAVPVGQTTYSHLELQRKQTQNSNCSFHLFHAGFLHGNGIFETILTGLATLSHSVSLSVRKHHDRRTHWNKETGTTGSIPVLWAVSLLSSHLASLGLGHLPMWQKWAPEFSGFPKFLRRQQQLVPWSQ